MDYQELDKEISRLDELLPQFSLFNLDFDHIFEQCRNIQDGFNSKPRYPTKEQRETAWNRFNQLRSRAHNLHYS